MMFKVSHICEPPQRWEVEVQDPVVNVRVWVSMHDYCAHAFGTKDHKWWCTGKCWCFVHESDAQQFVWTWS